VDVFDMVGVKIKAAAALSEKTKESRHEKDDDDNQLLRDQVASELVLTEYSYLKVVAYGEDVELRFSIANDQHNLQQYDDYDYYQQEEKGVGEKEAEEGYYYGGKEKQPTEAAVVIETNDEFANMLQTRLFAVRSTSSSSLHHHSGHVSVKLALAENILSVSETLILFN
jgi:hypothetical protein